MASAPHQGPRGTEGGTSPLQLCPPACGQAGLGTDLGLQHALCGSCDILPQPGGQFRVLTATPQHHDGAPVWRVHVSAAMTVLLGYVILSGWPLDGQSGAPRSVGKDW